MVSSLIVKVIFRFKAVVLLGLIFLLPFYACTKKNETPMASPTTSISPVIADSYVDRIRVYRGEEVKFTVETEYNKGFEINLPELGGNISGLGVIDSGRIDVSLSGERNKKLIWYRLAADDAGSFRLPSVIVAYFKNGVKKGEIKTPEIFIDVVPDGSPLFLRDEIKDIKPLAEIKSLNGLKWLVIIFPAVAAISVLLFLYFYFLRKKPVPEIKEAPLPYEIALSEYDILKSKGFLESGKIKDFYFELSNIFRRYLQGRFGMRAVECTSEEIIHILSKIRDIKEDSFFAGKIFLLETDMIKYTNLGPPEDLCEKIDGLFVRFIEDTRQSDIGVEFGAD